MKIQNMQNLFVDVLNSRDLTRAGDLFQIDDGAICCDLSQLLGQIETISSAHDFSQKLNDQSVVEICLTRITSAIRDTGTIEKHARALVSLLESCLRQDLRPSKKDCDPFHAKIANELISCIFLNHDKKVIMRNAVPVAVKLLHRGNKELSRNLSSYLSLAAINNAEVLADHLSLIIDSVISGNFTLARVLPKIYPIRKEPIHDHVMALVCLLPQCETPEKLSLLALFQLIAKVEPKLLESNLPELSETLEQPQTAYPTLQIFLNIAQMNAKPFLEYINRVVSACSLQQGMLSIAAQFLSLIGRLDLNRACDCCAFLTSALTHSDLSTTIVILKEIKSIVEVFPCILSNFLKDILLVTRNSSSNTVHKYLQELQLIHEQTAGQQSGSTARVNCDQGSFLSGNNHLIHSFNHPNSLYNHHAAQNSIYDLGLSQTKSSNFKLNSSNFRLPISSGSYKLVSTININPNSDSIHRSIPRLQHSSSSHKIGKQLSCSSQMHRSLTNCSNQKHGPLDYHHCSADSIATNNQLTHALTHNSSPSSSSNQNITGFRTSRPEINPYARINHNLSTLLAGERSNYHLDAIYSTNNSSSKALLASSTNCNILDNPQLLQLQSSSFVNTAAQTNFLSYSLNSKNYANNYYESGNRDGIRLFEQFCEKHFDKMKDYMERVYVKLPIPVRCSVGEERKSKKAAKLQLHFLCQIKDSHCLFSKTFFTMQTTRYVRTWIHLMFLDLQAKSEQPLYMSSPAVCALRNCWDALNDTHKESSGSNRNFLTLVCGAFPSTKDQELLINELKRERYTDVFEFNALIKSWNCYSCNNPEKLNENPVIQGQLAAKSSGKWRLFRRWRERYFTLTGLSLSYRDKNSKNADQVEIGKVQSVRISSKRNKPNVFEIFTISKNEQKTYLLKAKNNKMSSEWVQCLSIAMAHSQAKENASN